MFQMIPICPLSEGGSIFNCVFDDDYPTLREFCREISNGNYAKWGFIDIRLSSVPVKTRANISYHACAGINPIDDYIMDYEVETANCSGNNDRMDYIVILRD